MNWSQSLLCVRWKKMVSVAITICVTAFFFFVHNAQALKNPAAVYCISMGYDYIEEENGKNQCQIPGSDKVFPEWDFYTGKVGQQYGYCAINGYEVKTVYNSKLCPISSIGDECAVCIINNEAVPVAVAMKLDFREAPCGDGKCFSLENYLSCPQDCPSGVADGICDGVADGKCDDECTQVVVFEGYVPKPDPDCKPVTVRNSSAKTDLVLGKKYKLGLAILGILGGLISIVFAGYYFRKKVKENDF